ncbi:MAG: DEAD/DEAH box helicase [Nitrospiraceae bacterium]
MVKSTMPLASFHPITADWFRRSVGTPTDVQAQAWPAIRARRNTLIAAPTGSGKTLAAFLTCIDDLLQQALACSLDDRTQILYVSPLKALSNDIQKNLRRPLTAIGDAALQAGLLVPELRAAVRTGDTPMAERQQMLRRPPHILVTTPESLFILLTADKSRALLSTVHTVIVDEIHAVAGTKRGAHLALSLERLDTLTREKPVRVGLSATQRPIEAIGRFLTGSGEPPTIIDMGHRRAMDLAVEVPKDELGAVATTSVWTDLYDRVAELVRAHRSTLVFVNTRRLAERVSLHLMERLEDLGPRAVAAHHGSLAKERRLSAETRLKDGETRVVVATASLELGIDVGTIDLVCQIGSPRSIAVALQRVGRAGHWVGAMPKGRLFATTCDELLECAALVRAIRSGTLDRIVIPEEPLDILAQQLVAAAATGSWDEDELYALARRAYPYRALAREQFDAVVRMLADGIATGRGRGQAYLHHDRINRRIKGRRGARLAAITSGGAIPDTANYAVVAEPDGTVVGSVDEDFAVESMAGDIMLLGNTSWRIKGVERGTVRVEDAQGAPPNIPFWRGEAPARTAELSAAVGMVREEILTRASDTDSSVLSWLAESCGLDQRGAQQAVEFILAGQAVLGAVPTQACVIAERFFDESGGMQLVLHAPFGGRINKAWGLALRKRLCVTFDFELQAAATDEGLVISLGEKHSFPLASVFEFVHADRLREVLTPAILQSPMFTTRWRWNAARSLALLRFAKGKKVPPQIQRMRAEDLLAAVFPDAIACQDNFRGDRVEREVPDHPLAQETMRDCLTEAMDVEGLEAVLRGIASGAIACRAVETPTPSVFSHGILNANPYAFLDDAPLEERRARAVEMRRTLPPALAGDVGALDPEAIATVVRESWPVVRDADELHDALLTFVVLPSREAPEWAGFAHQLQQAGRAIERRQRFASVETTVWCAKEQEDLMEALFAREDEAAAETLVHGWMESIGPVTDAGLAARVGLPEARVTAALHALEAKGQVIRGQFTTAVSPGPTVCVGGAGTSPAVEWCHRRLLARIHRLTIGALRREIEPVTAAEFSRFLLDWQHVAPGARVHGEAGLREVLGQLAGFEAAASAWESQILRARVERYDPAWLDRLCLGGVMSWGRVSARATMANTSESTRTTPSSTAPITFFARADAEWIMQLGESADARAPLLSAPAQAVAQALAQRGASFCADLQAATGLLECEVERALWELVSAGVATADGFDNLRALLDPKRRRGEGRARSRRPSAAAGRWALLRPMIGRAPAPTTKTPDGGAPNVAERMARQLLARYGVVFRDLVRREVLLPTWREVLVQLRRMELQGEARGGRFVSGPIGEQYALPQAVEALRAMRKGKVFERSMPELRLSAADPLNLTGVLLPRERVPSVASHLVLFRNGLPVGRVEDGSPVTLDTMGAQSRRGPWARRTSP